MPTIAVNLGDVVAFKDLEVGTYLCEIQKIVHQDAKEAGKFPQLRVHYAVIDGDSLGERTTEWVSLSPAAAFRLKKWFMHFGFEDIENLEVDDDSLELTDPDLIGVRVIVEVKKDAKAPGGQRTSLISCEDDMSAQAANAPDPEPAAPAPARTTVRTAAPAAVAGRAQRQLR